MAASGISVPELVSLNQQQAIAKLNAVGLTHNSEYALNLHVLAGKVFETKPPAAALLITNAAVTLVISAHGGWVYLNQVVIEPYTNGSQAKNMRSDDDNSGRKIGTLQARESVKVIESKANGWTLVQAIEP